MIFGIVGIAYGAVWFLVLREGAPYADTAAVSSEISRRAFSLFFRKS